MALKSSLRSHQTQSLALTPGLLQSLGLLRMPATELLEEVQRQVAENPLLEMMQIPSGSVPFDDVAPWIANAPGLTVTLQEQIALMNLPQRVTMLAQFLAGDLDENGYLQTELDALAENAELTSEEIDTALKALQSCDPPGIGARNLTECLYLQLCAKNVSAAESETICAHLDLFAKRDFSKLERQTGITRKRLEQIDILLQELTPHPAANFAEPSQTLVPDVFVERRPDGDLDIRNNTTFIPDVRLDEAMLQKLDGNDPLRQTYRARAEAMIRGLRYRGDTVNRIATAIVQHQIGFFTDGPEHIVPLTRATLAQELGLHPSTVGRAIAGKVLGFEGGSIPFEQFLSSALTSQDGIAVSGRAAQSRIARIVAKESKANPLSDDQIADILRAEGVDISRRTVAKYRGCLDIPSSFKRRRSQASP